MRRNGTPLVNIEKLEYNIDIFTSLW